MFVLEGPGHLQTARGLPLEHTDARRICGRRTPGRPVAGPGVPPYAIGEEAHAPRLSMRTTIRAALLGILAIAGCASPRARGSGDLSNAEIEAIYAARRDSARNRFTDADVRFMSGMIGHHAQAIVMSELAPARTTSQSIRILAARIINAQKDEIALMQRWLRLRNQTVPAAGAGSASAHDAHDAHDAHAGAQPDHAAMPGMLTPAQLDELRNSRGTDFDRLFLRFMVQHHRGAVTMVQKLVATDGAVQDEDAFKIASDIQADQITEIERMQLMLKALDGTERK